MVSAPSQTMEKDFPFPLLPSHPGWGERKLRSLLILLDSFLNRLFSSRYNPLYASGMLALLCFGILVVSGLYLFLFYHSSSPYESVRYTTEAVFLGRFARGVHRLASDLLIFFVILHAIRMGVEGKFRPPRSLAWIAGFLLIGVFLLEGWTGFLLVWDQQSQTLALYLAEFLDLFPLFSEKLSRTVAGGVELNASFFFFFLFLHLALPLLVLFLFWLHTLHLKSPRILPSHPLLLGTVAMILCTAALFPPSLLPPANPFRIPDPLLIDLWYGFWIPLIPLLGTPLTWGAMFTLWGWGALLPLLPHRQRLSPASVKEEFCTGCTQCALDCPYEAITMILRPSPSPLSTHVARVDPKSCVSCGICAGSCAPMFMGPPGRSGRDQYRWAVAFARKNPGRIVVFRCTRHTPDLSPSPLRVILSVGCVGEIHTATLLTLIRKGIPGVALISCPMDACEFRVGARYTYERLFLGREAELHPQVERQRVLFLELGKGEERLLVDSLKDLEKLLPGVVDQLPDPELSYSPQKIGQK